MVYIQAMVQYQLEATGTRKVQLEQTGLEARRCERGRTATVACRGRLACK